MEINQHQHLYPVWKDFVRSQLVSGVQTKSHRDTLQMTPCWWLRMRNPVCMCITQCQWSEHYLCVDKCFIRLNETWRFQKKLNFSFLWKKLIPLARSCPTKVLQEFSKLWLVIFCMNGYSCPCVTHLHNQVPRYNFEWIIIGAIPHKFNQNRCYSTDIY